MRLILSDWEGARVRDVHGRITACCDGCDIPGTSGEVSIAESKANAYLIAAAPRMLKTLENAELVICKARLGAGKVDEANGHTSSQTKLFPANQAVVQATEALLDQIRSLLWEIEPAKQQEGLEHPGSEGPL